MIDVERIREGVSEVLSIPLSELKDDTNIDDCDNWDSLATVSTAAMIFEMTNITVSPEEMDKVVLFKDIINIAELKVQKKNEIENN